MENLVKHVQPLQRRYPGAVRVASIGFIGAKRDTVDHPFPSFNVSFILAGSGHYRFAGRTWPVEAPCVITQWPGEHMTYGPADTWDELYLIYPAESLPTWREMGVAREARPTWRMASAGRVARRAEEVRQLLLADDLAERVDEVDRLCELMVVTSLLARPVGRRPVPQEAIHRARAYVDEHFGEPVVWDVLAGSHGMSLATFRRHWSKHMPVPPGAYLTQVRIRRACELLAETDLPVGQIGHRVGYDDELYFSRRFREVTGVTASDYRVEHRPPT